MDDEECVRLTLYSPPDFVRHVRAGVVKVEGKRHDLGSINRSTQGRAPGGIVLRLVAQVNPVDGGLRVELCSAVQDLTVVGDT